MGGAANRVVLSQVLAADSRRARDLCTTGALSAGSCRSVALAQLHRAAFGQASSLELGLAKTQSAGSWIAVLLLADPPLCCRWVAALTAADAAGNPGRLIRLGRLSSPLALPESDELVLTYRGRVRQMQRRLLRTVHSASTT